MSFFQGLVIASLAATIAIVPFGLGILFGFAAFFLTPVLMAVLLVFAGALIAKISPAGLWAGVILAALVIAAVYAIQLTLGELGPTKGDAPLRMFSRVFQIFLPVAIVSAAFLSLGAWLWTRVFTLR